MVINIPQRHIVIVGMLMNLDRDESHNSRAVFEVSVSVTFRVHACAR